MDVNRKQNRIYEVNTNTVRQKNEQNVESITV